MPAMPTSKIFAVGGIYPRAADSPTQGTFAGHRGPGTEGWYSHQRCPPLLLTSRCRATARYMETLEDMMLNRRPQGPCPRWWSSHGSCVAHPRCPPRRTRYHRRATARLQCVVCGGVHRSGQGQWWSASMSGAPWRGILTSGAGVAEDSVRAVARLTPSQCTQQSSPGHALPQDLQTGTPQGSTLHRVPTHHLGGQVASRHGATTPLLAWGNRCPCGQCNEVVSTSR
jgi:hypothetical protein